ncbi:4200_t:CDS:2 [Paraglomus occultum]|uniref:4200_t:CDS:1 n=1 Tax=Paraglomus occultum TaxID=144539 RepID=A0A9N9FJ82_9GLOM|nr:4200_t:CDS:2 [Paraglomus occultum]
MSNAKCDSYFYEVDPKNWRFVDFYRHRQSRGEFSASFKTEALVLRRSLDYQLEKGSEQAKVYAERLLGVFSARIFKGSKGFLPMTTENKLRVVLFMMLRDRYAGGASFVLPFNDLRDRCSALKSPPLNNHRNLEDVEAFWKMVETQKSEKEQLECSKTQALRSVFEGATMYTNQVFQTAVQNLISGNIVNERKRQRPAEESYPIFKRPPNLRDCDQHEEVHHIDCMESQEHRKTSEDVCTPAPGDIDDGKHESEEEKPEQIEVDLEDLARIIDMVPLIEINKSYRVLSNNSPEKLDLPLIPPTAVRYVKSVILSMKA